MVKEDFIEYAKKDAARLRLADACMDEYFKNFVFDFEIGGWFDENAVWMWRSFVHNNIMDDSEFYLVHDKSKDRWMFTLCQDWIETSARKDCERCGLSFEDCTYAYLDIDRG